MINCRCSKYPEIDIGCTVSLVSLLLPLPHGRQMDVGVGLFVVVNGIAEARARHPSSLYVIIRCHLHHGAVSFGVLTVREIFATTDTRTTTSAATTSTACLLSFIPVSCFRLGAYVPLCVPHVPASPCSPSPLSACQTRCSAQTPPPPAAGLSSAAGCQGARLPGEEQEGGAEGEEGRGREGGAWRVGRVPRLAQECCDGGFQESVRLVYPYCHK